MNSTEPVNYKHDMLSAATAYCELRGIKLSTLGRLIVNDGKFFDRMKGESGCTIKTYQHVMGWFRDNMPS